MREKVTKDQYLNLVEDLNNYNYNYHVLNVSLISDYEYDQLFKSLLEIEKENPEWIVENSPSKKIGDNITTSQLKKNRHLQKMYSLDNIFDIPTLTKWVIDALIKLKGKKKQIIISPKLDGLSLNLLYKEGKLVQATTRGDGIEGEDVLKNVKYVNGVVDAIPYKGTIEIRGEVLMSKETFKRINEEQEKLGLEKFKTPRNAAAGSLRQNDPIITKSRNLDFISWGIGKVYDSVFSSLSDFLVYLSKLDGIIPLKYISFKGEVYEEPMVEKIISNVIESFTDYRNTGEYEIDGIVFMVDDFQVANELGYTIRAPRFGVAYKFQAQEYITKINSVTWQVGRTGILTPVGEIDPVVIDGVTVSRCTLHNLEDINRKGIGLGSQVAIIRSGDVIPKILRSLDSEGSTTIMIQPPEECPSCNYPTIVTKNKVICPNPKCKDRLIASIVHMASRECLNIQGLGEEIIKLLVDKGLIMGPEDIFKLTYDDLIKLDGFMDKKVNNLLCSINLAKGIEAWKFVNSLGLSGIGKGSSQLLTKIYGLDFLTGKIKLENVNISGFSTETLTSLSREIDANREKIDKLMTLIEPTVTKHITKFKDGITGKTFVITGTLSKPRETFKEIITNYGGRVTGSVSSTTDYLLSGSSPGTKYQDAVRLNVRIINEQDLEGLLK